MSDSHGRSLVLKLDDAAGALQTITSSVRKVGGFPGKTDRPDTSAAGDDAQRYEVVGKSEGGPISIGGLWREQAGTKRHGRQMRLLHDQFSLTAKLRTLAVSRAIDIPDTDAAGNDWKRRELVGKKSGSMSFGGKLDSAAGLTDPVFWANLRAATPVVLSAAVGGFTIGNLVELLNPYETSYNIDTDHNTGPNSVSAEFVPDGPIDLGVSLHDQVVEVAVGPNNYASVDEVAQTLLGWVAHLHITAYSGWTNVTVKLQDSADNSVWADLAGGGFTLATAVGTQRLAGAATATVRRYVRAVSTNTGAGSVTFVVAFARRGSTYGAAGTYRHLVELYGHANTQSVEYGPEGSTTGKVKYTAEARLSKLDISVDHGSGPVEFSAEMVVDDAVATTTWP